MNEMTPLLQQSAKSKSSINYSLYLKCLSVAGMTLGAVLFVISLQQDSVVWAVPSILTSSLSVALFQGVKNYSPTEEKTEIALHNLSA